MEGAGRSLGRRPCSDSHTRTEPPIRRALPSSRRVWIGFARCANRMAASGPKPAVLPSPNEGSGPGQSTIRLAPVAVGARLDGLAVLMRDHAFFEGTEQCPIPAVAIRRQIHEQSPGIWCPTLFLEIVHPVQRYPFKNRYDR